MEDFDVDLSDDDDEVVEGPGEWIPLSDPDMSGLEVEAMIDILRAQDITANEAVGVFEERFAARLGRRYAVGVSGSTVATLAVLRARGIGPGDEVIASPYSWHQIAQAVAHVGAKLVMADIEYWSQTLCPKRVAEKLTPATRAIIVGNTNGHPAPWREFRALAEQHGLFLIEDCTESIGSRYAGKEVGSFGDVAIFDFTQPSPLVAGEGALIVTDDLDLYNAVRQIVVCPASERFSVATAHLPLQAPMGGMNAALALAQLDRLDTILAKRRAVAEQYLFHMRSFEGIKPPYVAPDVDEVHFHNYVVHLGTRFGKDARDQIVEDLRTAGIDVCAVCRPLHLHPVIQKLYGSKRRDFLVAEKIGDRSIAIPFHAQLTDQVCKFIVKTAKDSSANVGAGAAIY